MISPAREQQPPWNAASTSSTVVSPVRKTRAAVPLDRPAPRRAHLGEQRRLQPFVGTSR
jgi:hypothetical protein